MKIDKQKLYVAMARACMNTSDIQKITEMPRPTINNAISGRNISPATLGKIASALEVDVTELIEDMGD